MSGTRCRTKIATGGAAGIFTVKRERGQSTRLYAKLTPALARHQHFIHDMESQDQQDSSQRADGASNSISSSQVMFEESGTSQVSKFFIVSPETFVALRRNSLR
jgi:hypothetical protein